MTRQTTSASSGKIQENEKAIGYSTAFYLAFDKSLQENRADMPKKLEKFELACYNNIVTQI